MKVIFRSNNRLAKRTLGKDGAEELLQPLNKYLSDDAVLRLSLFEEGNNINLATLDIIDGSLHVHATEKQENLLTALESVINKCSVQLKKDNIINNFNDSIRYNDKYNYFDNLSDDLEFEYDVFDLLEVEKKLEAEKRTKKYNHIMNKYVDYLYRKNEIESIQNHLNILYSIYSQVDKETITVADYDRLVQSIKDLFDELQLMLEEQKYFENNTKFNTYINNIIDQEETLAKLKR